MNNQIDIQQIAAALNNRADTLVPQWLPNGKKNNNEWVALNPKRKDDKLGSFSICLSGGKAGQWCDFATGDKGGDLVSLFAYLHNLNNFEAAKELAETHGLDTNPVQTAGDAEFKKKQSDRDKWLPIMPIPDFAMSSMPVQWHNRTPEKIFCYQSKSGEPLCFVFRVVKEDGSKATPPLCFAKNEAGTQKWVFRSPEKPRPLFGLQNLTDTEDEVVLIVEGEKCGQVFDNHQTTEPIAKEPKYQRLAIISWLGGCKGWNLSDWSPIFNKKVILWADNDAGGKKAMNSIAQHLTQNGCQCRFVNIPNDKPKGWDIADCFAESGAVETLTRIWDYSQNEYFIKDEQNQDNKTPDYELQQSEPNQEKKEKQKKSIFTKQELGEIWSRFVYIDGTDEIFDKKYKKIITQTAANMAMGGRFKSWIRSDKKLVLPPDAIVFDPTGEKMPDGGINLFDGFPEKFERLKPVDMSSLTLEEILDKPKKCPAIIRLIKHLCNNDLEQVEWLLNWLALPLQKKGTKMFSAVLAHSFVHGAGKSLFFDKVMRELYSEKYSRHLTQTDIESNFNANREHCLYGVFEEIFTSKSKYDLSGSLKDLITGGTQRIERKNFDAKEANNFMNCVLLSNQLQPFPIEEHDRRYFVLCPAEKLPQDIADAVIDELNNDGILAFYRFLISLPLTLTAGGRRGVAKGVAFRANTQPLTTDAKTAIIKWGYASWQSFYSQWKDDEISNTPFISCTATDLWLAYCKWCDLNGEQRMKKTQFIIAMRTKLKYKRIRYKNAIVYKEVRAYCFLTTEKATENDYSDEINQFAEKINSAK